LRSPVRVDDRAVGVPKRDGVAQGRDRQVCGHAIADRVADESTRTCVHQAAEIELALGSPVLGDVGEPDLIDRLGGELPLDEIVVNRRAWLLARAGLLDKARPDPLLGAEPPHPPCADLVALLVQLVQKEAVAESGIFEVSLERSVGEHGVLVVTIRAGTPEPLVVALGRELEHPAGHRDGDPVSGQLADQRVFHFGGSCLAK